MKRNAVFMFSRVLIVLIFSMLSELLMAQSGTDKWVDHASEPSGWTTSSTEITISSGGELAWVSKMVNENSQTGQAPEDKGFKGVTISLSGDIDLSGYDWTAIGEKEDLPFRGTFDGNNHSILNMKVETLNAAGLFGYIDEGEIKRVKLTNCSVIKINTANDYVMADNYAGGVVGSSTASKIINCSVSGSIEYAKGKGGEVGGICGHNNGGTIDDCRFEGTLKSTLAESVTNTTSAWVGGIAGHNYNETKITNCHVTNLELLCEFGEAGGITAYNTGTIVNCTVSGKIDAVQEPIVYGIGGIVGCNVATNIASVNSIDNCISECDISLLYKLKTKYDTNSSSLGYAKVGGIAGMHWDDSAPIRNCKASGKMTVEIITDMSADTDLAKNECRVGGIIGYSESSVLDCEASVQIIASTGVESTNVYVGGVVGYAFQAPITNCKTKQSDLSVGTTNKGTCYVGGIVGMALYRPITNCDISQSAVSAKGNANNCYAGGIAGYSRAAIIDCSSDATVTVGETQTKSIALPSYSYAGGIVAQMGYKGGYYSDSVKNCSSKGLVAASGGNCYVGGVAGLSYRHINNSYSTSQIRTEGNNCYAGGLVGSNDANTNNVNPGGCIRNCYATGEIYAKGSNQNAVGGIAGNNRDSIINCYSTSKLESVSETKSYVGGIAGLNYKRIENCVGLNTSGIINSTASIGRILGWNSSSSGIALNNHAHEEIPGTWDESDITKNGSQWDRISYPFSDKDAWDTSNSDILPLLRKMGNDGMFSDKIADQPSLPIAGLNFYILTIDVPEHGKLTVTDHEGLVLKSGERISSGSSLMLLAEPNGGYKLKHYVVNGLTTSETTAVITEDMTISAVFKALPQPPVYVWYNVRAPSTEGIVYIRNGVEFDSLELDVLEGSRFSFFLSAKPGYSLENIHVSTSRGDIIVPSATDGKYVIRNINEDIEVLVDGAFPVSNESISEDNIRLYARDGVLLLDLPTALAVSIFDIRGILQYRARLEAGNNKISLSSGIYLVVFENGKTVKIVI